MLDDGHGRRNLRIELRHELDRRVGVPEIVVGELLALVLHGCRHSRAPLAGYVEGRPLVRVLAIAQLLGEPAGDRTPARCALAQGLGEPVADRRIVGGRARVGLGRQRLAQRQTRGAAVLGHLGQDRRIVLRIDHDRHGSVVLGGGPDHRRPADVDVLDALGIGRALRHGRLEGVEIDHEQIDGRNPVR